MTVSGEETLCVLLSKDFHPLLLKWRGEFKWRRRRADSALQLGCYYISNSSLFLSPTNDFICRLWQKRQQLFSGDIGKFCPSAVPGLGNVIAMCHFWVFQSFGASTLNTTHKHSSQTSTFFRPMLCTIWTAVCWTTLETSTLSSFEQH